MRCGAELSASTALPLLLLLLLCGLHCHASEKVTLNAVVGNNNNDDAAAGVLQLNVKQEMKGVVIFEDADGRPETGKELAYELVDPRAHSQATTEVAEDPNAAGHVVSVEVGVARMASVAQYGKAVPEDSEGGDNLIVIIAAAGGGFVVVCLVVGAVVYKRRQGGGSGGNGKPAESQLELTAMGDSTATVAMESNAISGTYVAVMVAVMACLVAAGGVGSVVNSAESPTGDPALYVYLPAAFTSNPDAVMDVNIVAGSEVMSAMESTSFITDRVRISVTRPAVLSKEATTVSDPARVRAVAEHAGGTDLCASFVHVAPGDGAAWAEHRIWLEESGTTKGAAGMGGAYQLTLTGQLEVPRANASLPADEIAAEALPRVFIDDVAVGVMRERRGAKSDGLVHFRNDDYLALSGGLHRLKVHLPAAAERAGFVYCAPSIMPVAEADVHASVAPALRKVAGGDSEAAAAAALTWAEADGECAALGMRLCTHEELCPRGPKKQPFFGMMGRAMSLPVAGRDSWVSIGHPGWEQQLCVRSTDPGPGVADKGFYMCCPETIVAAHGLFSLSAHEAALAARVPGRDPAAPKPPAAVAEAATSASWASYELQCLSEGKRLCLTHELCSPTLNARLPTMSRFEGWDGSRSAHIAVADKKNGWLNFLGAGEECSQELIFEDEFLPLFHSGLCCAHGRDQCTLFEAREGTRPCAEDERCVDGVNGHHCVPLPQLCEDKLCYHGEQCDPARGACVCLDMTEEGCAPVPAKTPCAAADATAGGEGSFCGEHGECVDHGPAHGSGWATCACEVGWTGARCAEEQVGEACRAQPCQNFGVCAEVEVAASTDETVDASTQPVNADGTLATYRCSCKPGWSGRHCQEAVPDTPCARHAGCGAHGACVVVEADGSLAVDRSDLSASLVGKSLDQRKLLEQEAMAAEQAQKGTCWCARGQGGGVAAACKPSCHGVSCHNGGTCAGAGQCRCVAPFAGRDCTSLDPCAVAGACSGNGACTHTDDVFAAAPAGKRPSVAAGIAALEAAAGGVGVTMGAKCTCKPGYRGENCEEWWPCDSAQCFNGAECVADKSLQRGYTCTCPPGYEGDHCNIRSDWCAGHDCVAGGGFCVPNQATEGRGFRCECFALRGGDRCEVDLASEATFNLCLTVSALPNAGTANRAEAHLFTLHDDFGPYTLEMGSGQNGQLNNFPRAAGPAAAAAASGDVQTDGKLCGRFEAKVDSLSKFTHLQVRVVRGDGGGEDALFVEHAELARSGELGLSTSLVTHWNRWISVTDRPPKLALLTNEAD